MDFKDQIKQLGDRIAKMLPQIHTEEATKTSLTLPFIQILGYDIFNPGEVNPELKQYLPNSLKNPLNLL